MKFSIRSTLIVCLLGLLAGTQVVTSALKYAELVAQVENEIRSVNEARSVPLMDLATRSIDGANQMILNNAEAKALFESTDALWIQMDGTSAGSEKTLFAPAIPPQKIHFEFSNGNSEQNTQVKDLVNSHNQTGFLEQGHYYLVVKSLPKVKNGGELKILYSSAQLIERRHQLIITTIESLLITLLLGSAVAWYAGYRLSAPLIKMQNH
ncbi:MAG TPA: hypothetical protein VFM46_14405, partial [Pseudomonadales bacterium]|nr:hypothetical protein [Pseudomonadales bacterium]